MNLICRLKNNTIHSLSTPQVDNCFLMQYLYSFSSHLSLTKAPLLSLPPSRLVVKQSSCRPAFPGGTLMATLRHSDVHKHSTTKWLLLRRYILYSVLSARQQSFSSAAHLIVDLSQCDKLPSSCNIDVFMIHVFSCSLLNYIYKPLGFCCCCCATYKPHPHVFTTWVSLCRTPSHFIRNRN